MAGQVAPELHYCCCVSEYVCGRRLAARCVRLLARSSFTCASPLGDSAAPPPCRRRPLLSLSHSRAERGTHDASKHASMAPHYRPAARGGGQTQRASQRASDPPPVTHPQTPDAPAGQPTLMVVAQRAHLPKACRNDAQAEARKNHRAHTTSATHHSQN
jgi:hypothetical protein